jgi:hypothetical protein
MPTSISIIVSAEMWSSSTVCACGRRCRADSSRKVDLAGGRLLARRGLEFDFLLPGHLKSVDNFGPWADQPPVFFVREQNVRFASQAENEGV